MPQHPDDTPEEPLGAGMMMSLADALTSVFGAAIALFLIFLVLVKLEPERQARASSAEAVPLGLRSETFAEAIRGGASVTLILWSEDCDELLKISVKTGRTAEIWLSEGKDDAACRLLVHLGGGINDPLALYGAAPGSRLKLRVLIGNRMFQLSHLHIDPSHTGNNNVPFLEIHANGQMFPEETK